MPLVRQRPFLEYLSLVFATSLLYFAASYALTRLGFGNGRLILSPLNGITLAVLLKRRRPDWPPILLGGCIGVALCDTFALHTPTAQIVLHLISLVAVVIGALIFPPFRELEGWLRKHRITSKFAAALTLGPCASGLIATLFLHRQFNQSYGMAFSGSAIADMIGIAGVFPLALAIDSSEMAALFRPKTLLRTLVILGLAFFTITLALYSSRYPLIFLVYPTLLAVDVLLTFAGSSIAAAGLCAISLYLTVHAHGIFGAWPMDLPVSQSAALQTFLAFHLLALFPASILIRERRSLIQDLHSSNAQLHMLASLDGLTGILNRRSFEEHFDQEWKRAIRLKTPLALVMIDVDRFKEYNDLYGHHAGDECLRTVAQTLRTNLRRAQDRVARYGGEEFALLLPHTDLPGAQHLSEIVREAIENLTLTHDGSPWKFVSISIGCASLIPDVAVSQRELLNLADAALYRAKHAGRNRVEVASVAPDPRTATVRSPDERLVESADSK